MPGPEGILLIAIGRFYTTLDREVTSARNRYGVWSCPDRFGSLAFKSGGKDASYSPDTRPISSINGNFSRRPFRSDTAGDRDLL